MKARFRQSVSYNSNNNKKTHNCEKTMCKIKKKSAFFTFYFMHN